MDEGWLLSTKIVVIVASIAIASMWNDWFKYKTAVRKMDADRDARIHAVQESAKQRGIDMENHVRAAQEETKRWEILLKAGRMYPEKRD